MIFCSFYTYKVTKKWCWLQVRYQYYNTFYLDQIRGFNRVFFFLVILFKWKRSLYCTLILNKQVSQGSHCAGRKVQQTLSDLEFVLRIFCCWQNLYRKISFKTLNALVCVATERKRWVCNRTGALKAKIMQNPERAQCSN